MVRSTNLSEAIQPFIKEKIEDEILHNLVGEYERRLEDVKEWFIKEAERIAAEKSRMVSKEVVFMLNQRDKK